MNPEKVHPINERVPEIDGLRGWASLCVLFFHLIWELFGVVNPFFNMPILHFFFDGPLAVYVFFILSGDALSLGITGVNGRGISTRMVLKRYFRLAGPILFSCAVTYGLMKCGLIFSEEAGILVGRPDWLSDVLQFSPSIYSVLKQGLLETFVNLTHKNSYNPFMWPMSVEICGSMIIFCFGHVCKSLKSPQVVVACCAVYLTMLSSFYALFFIGMLFGFLRRNMFFKKLQDRPNNSAATLMLALLLVLLDSHLINGTPQSSILMATITVFLAYSSRNIVGFMKNRVSGFLGKISFPLYFMQFSVIVSYTSWTIVYFWGATTNKSLFYSFSIGTSAILAILVATIVEVLEANYLKKIDVMMRHIIRTSGYASPY